MKRGFTLIELLVVVAIIGILAAIVLAALQSSRSKGSDASIKTLLAHAIPLGEVFYNVNTVAPSTYTSVCSKVIIGGAQGIGIQIKAAAVAAGLANFAINVTGSGTTATCNVSASADAWASEVPLTGSTVGVPNMWCVDSTGRSKQESVSIGAGTACN